MGGAADTGAVFGAGAVAGIAEGVCIQPLEMIKTRFQINEGAPMKVIPTAHAIIREGGLRQLYRGGLPEIVGLVPRSAAMWSGYEISRRELIRLNGGTCTTWVEGLAGAFAGCCEAVAFSPFQVVKVRLMAKEHLGRYKNTMDCTAQIIRTEGVLALSIGVVPTMWRNCIWDSIYLAGMFNIDQHVPKPESSALRWVQHGALGTAMGMFATLFNVPFDVCKSRMQARLPDKAHENSTTFGTLRQIASEEGIFALYKGLTPKALRLGAGQTIGLTVFQLLVPKETI